MKVISTSGGIRLTSLLMFLTLPLAALQTAIWTRSPWWKLPLESMAWSAGTAAIFTLPFSFLVLRGHAWASRIFIVLGGLWSLFSAIFSVQMHYPTMGFFTALLLLFFTQMYFRLRQELERSFFNPMVAWYQGTPKRIPGIFCEIELPNIGAKTRLKVCRLDSEGAFLFHEKISLPNLRRKQPLQLRFLFKNIEFLCDGIPKRYFRNQQGVGLKFISLSPDKQKELDELIDALRGEGYVE